MVTQPTVTCSLLGTYVYNMARYMGDKRLHEIERWSQTWDALRLSHTGRELMKNVEKVGSINTAGCPVFEERNEGKSHQVPVRSLWCEEQPSALVSDSRIH